MKRYRCNKILHFLLCRRWVESKSGEYRGIEIWPNICKLVEFWGKLPSSKQLKSKSFLKVQKAVKNKLILLKFEVFSIVPSILGPYLLAYQTGKPIIPSMCSELERLLRNMLKLFVKQEVIDKCSTPTRLKEIDIHKKNNVFKGKSIKLGFAAEIRLPTLRKKDTITNTDIEKLRKIALTCMYD